MDDNRITHNGVIYSPARNLAKLTAHLKSCPNCGGEGELYGRRCRECAGKGVIRTPITTLPRA